MKTVLFYHVYLDDHGHWSNIVNEQLSCAENFQLLDATDELHVTCVSNNYYKTKWLSVLVNSYFKRAAIEEVLDPFVDDLEMLNSYPNFAKDGVESKNTERYTQKKIYDMSMKENMRLLYFHSRGITFSLRTLFEARQNNTKWIYDNQYQKLTYLSRQFLNWAAIENWQQMALALNSYDVASINYQQFPMPHFSGNTWWTKSDYIKTLSDPWNITWWRNIQSNLPDGHALKTGFSSSDRFRDEFWINSNPEAKLYNLINLEAHENPLKQIVKKEVYASKTINSI